MDWRCDGGRIRARGERVQGGGQDGGSGRRVLEQSPVGTGSFRMEGRGRSATEDAEKRGRVRASEGALKEGSMVLRLVVGADSFVVVEVRAVAEALVVVAALIFMVIWKELQLWRHRGRLAEKLKGWRTGRQRKSWGHSS